MDRSMSFWTQSRIRDCAIGETIIRLKEQVGDQVWTDVEHKIRDRNFNNQLWNQYTCSVILEMYDQINE